MHQQDLKETVKKYLSYILDFIFIVTGLSTIWAVIKATKWFWTHRQGLLYYSLEKGKELEDKILGDKK